MERETYTGQTGELKSLKKFQKYEIRWVDSMSDDNDWTDVDSIDWDSWERGSIFLTMGYFIKETKDLVMFCQTYKQSSEERTISAIMAIPKVAIKSILKIDARE